MIVFQNSQHRRFDCSKVLKSVKQVDSSWSQAKTDFFWFVLGLRVCGPAPSKETVRLARSLLFHVVSVLAARSMQRRAFDHHVSSVTNRASRKYSFSQLLRNVLEPEREHRKQRNHERLPCVSGLPAVPEH